MGEITASAHGFTLFFYLFFSSIFAPAGARAAAHQILVDFGL